MAATAATPVTCAACHEAPTNVLTEAYPEDEYVDDLIKVTGGETDEPLARLTIPQSAACTGWMLARGVRFQPSLGDALHLGRTNACSSSAAARRWSTPTIPTTDGIELNIADLDGRRAGRPPAAQERARASNSPSSNGLTR